MSDTFPYHIADESLEDSGTNGNPDEETRASTVTITCECGETFTTIVYHAVNVTLEPELLYHLLADTLNVAVCPTCGRRARSAIPFVYHDMARGLFAYVFPNGELSDAERSQQLERLRTVYQRAVEESARLTTPSDMPGSLNPPKLHIHRTRDAIPEPAAPPMQVIFGIEQLRTLVDSLLEPEQRLGKVTLTARGDDPHQRERLRVIAQRLARE
ncbi:MAG TPA: CpXC domain-containing protein, partial [Ktedonobacterales bacterium]|nr:CpXC domain-containing protein [Ktedonobacterales bacterium]